MDTTFSILLGILAVLTLFRTTVYAFSVQEKLVAQSPSEVNHAEDLAQQDAFQSSQWKQEGHKRVDRSVKEDMEKGLKEFSDRMAKLPDQMGGAMKKFLEERGLSWDAIQKILGEIWKNVEQLIEMVKKAM